MHRNWRNLWKYNSVEAVEGPHLDEQLQHDDPEVQVESGDRQTAGGLSENECPVLRSGSRSQGDHHKKDGGQGHAHHQDHDVDQPRQEEPSERKKVLLEFNKKTLFIIYCHLAESITYNKI